MSRFWYLKQKHWKNSLKIISNANQVVWAFSGMEFEKYLRKGIEDIVIKKENDAKHFGGIKFVRSENLGKHKLV